MTTGGFTVGGVVQADEAIYIHRIADDQLIELCLASSFATVFAPRQMGKTSLMVRTANRLAEKGVRSVVINLEKLGTSTSADQWYAGLLTIIADSLQLDIDVVKWWQAHACLGHAQRLIEFLQDIVLREIAEPVVIFIDEIDLTLSLDFADDFFSAIRSIYDERPRTPAFKRISFVLIGVASPTDLIKDPHRTPFNVGHAVAMTDFTPDEADQLTQGFNATLEEARRVLGYLLQWTRGHPYLTQKLCRALLEDVNNWDEAGIKALVERTFLNHKGADDSNLQEVKRMLTKRAGDPYAMLSTYRDILRGRPVSDAQSPVKALLKLSGIVRTRRARLVVRNPIYRAVFDERWVREQMELLPVFWTRRLRRGLRRLAIILLVGLIPVSVLAGYRWYSAEAARTAAESARATAERAREAAESAQALEEHARREAEADSYIADLGRRAAEANALALRAQALATQDRQLSLRMLLSAAQRGWTPPVDQVLRQLMQPEPCVDLQGRVFGGAWPADGARLLVDAAVPRPDPLRNPPLDLVIPHMEQGDGPSPILSHDGQFILISDGKDQARVLDARTGKLIFQWRGTGGAVRNAVWSPDGAHRLLTIAGTSTARVSDAATGALQLTLPDHGAFVSSVAWSADSQRIATAGADGIVRVWDAGSGQALMVLTAPAGEASDLTWRDGTHLAVAGDDGSIHIWDTRNGGEPVVLRTHDGPILAVRWSPLMSYILTVDSDKKVRVWDADSRAKISILEAQLPLAAAVWSADERHILIADMHGSVCTYDTLERMLEDLKHIEPLSQEEEQRLLDELLPVSAPPISTQTQTPTQTPPPVPTEAKEPFRLPPSVTPTPTVVTPTPTPKTITPTIDTLTPTTETVTATTGTMTPITETVIPSKERITPTVTPTPKTIVPTGETAPPTTEAITPTLAESAQPADSGAGISSQMLSQSS